MTHSQFYFYFAIPDGYGRWLGGLRWSADGEAIEFASPPSEFGLTFAFRAQVAQFLDGMLAAGGRPYFAHALHLLYILGGGKEPQSRVDSASPHDREAFQRLARCFLLANRPYRNAGVLCARLCREAPRSPGSPPIEVLTPWLASSVALSPHAWRTPAPEPPGPPQAFEAVVAAALRDYSEDELRHWFRHGSTPLVDAGLALARATPPPPRPGEALKAVESRPRLRAAADLVPRLAGALSLPPRRLVQAELPVGGYTDVAARGLPEQILPGQFALDPDEFLRRFAERELLYFHREEPRAPTTREVVLVLDQGVRTWGEPRLVLSAAVLALCQAAHARGQSVRLAATSSSAAAIDPIAAAPDALGELLEASDLTPNPARALARALAGEPTGARDVVLLTHPRSLADPSIAEAVGLAGEETRLFAVAVERDGRVEFSQLRNGRPIAIGRCRVPIGPAAPDVDAPHPAPAAHAWKGDVEPIGFPFLLGPTHTIKDHLFTFDESGEWLLLANRHGLLRIWQIDGSGAEMLPRPYYKDALLVEVTSVVGVAGGFAVAGRIDKTAVAAHYDLRDRTCKVHVLSEARAEPHVLLYDRDRHALMAMGGPVTGRVVDLHSRPPQGKFVVSATTLDMPRFRDDRSAGVTLDPVTGVVRLRRGVDDPWQTFSLASEGESRFKGNLLIQARWRRNVLALLVSNGDNRRSLLVGRAEDGRWTAYNEFSVPRDLVNFALSPDGRRIAWRVGDRRLEVHAVNSGGPPVLVVPQGRVHSRLDLELFRDGLAVRTGRHLHLIAWGSGPLEHGVTHEARGAASLRIPPGFLPRRFHPTGHARRTSRYDGLRFYERVTDGVLTAAVDRFGQIAVFDRRDRLAAMLYVFRDRFAAWLPDGTRLGPIPILGGPPTPGAADRIAAALRVAAEADSSEGLRP